MKNLIKTMVLLFLFMLGFSIFTACEGDSGSVDILDKVNSITAFDFIAPVVNGTINESQHTIKVTVPNGTDVTALEPTITHTGAGISPDTGDSQDFTNPVTYTVTAADGSDQDYAVTVVVSSSTAKAITAFSFTSPAATGVIDENAKTIAVKALYANPTGLVATFTATGESVRVGSTVQTSGTTANNFTGPVTYTVTAEDGSTQDYTVTVTSVDPYSLTLRDNGPAGGFIFYINPNASNDGWKYLEAAPADQPASVWSNINSDVFGEDGGTGIGDGLTNTNLIIAQSGHENSAAKVCQEYSVDRNGATYDDWFLPSLSELEEMYNELYLTGIEGFAGVTYWSSSEYTTAVPNTGHGYAFREVSPGSFNDRKNKTYSVRPARAF